MPELKPEQREAIFHDEGNVLVSASAGSGKTFVMIERAIRLICDGKAKVSEILAATFTEAAASEMRERLKKAIEEKIAAGERSLAEQLPDVYTADVCTLHAFCGRLIRTYFFAAGVSPDFKIIDSDEANALKAEAMDGAFREFYAKKEPWFTQLTARYKRKRTDDALKELVERTFDYCETETSPEELMEKTAAAYSPEGYAEITKEYGAYLVKAIKPIKADARRAADGFKETGLKAGEEFAEKIYADACAIESGGLYAVKSFEGYKPPYSFPRNLSARDAENKTLAVGARDSLGKIIKRFGDNLADERTDAERAQSLKEHARGFFALVKRFGEIYAEKKRDENALDFSDLEHFALKALDDERVRDAVRNKYKYVFVDEYQDVNGVQEEIISRVSRGNAFMVGDVKQSIYGFRGCRPEIFSGKLRDMRARGEKTVLLNHNFRSSNAVINTVNEIFSYSMTEEYFGENYKETSALVSGGGYADGGEGRAELHLFKKETERRAAESPRIYDILAEIEKEKAESGTDISALIANLIRGELGKKYYDPKAKEFKRVTCSDIVILTRNRDGAYVEKVVSGLVKRGIPVASEVRQNVCDYPEVATLLYALKLVECFIDDVALVSVLKSKIGGFTEEDLAAVALFYTENGGNARGGFYRAFEYYIENAGNPLGERLARFKEYFGRVRFTSDYEGAGGTLQRLIKDAYYEEFLLSEPDGELKAKRVRRFTSLTESDGKPLTVSEFLRRAERGGDAFAVSECGGEDNVRIMTIHASKGLEFPVVIVCGLERKTNSREEYGDILADRELGFATRYYDDVARTFYETPFRGLIKEKMRENRMKEEMRLFYVATTRAAYSLHLTFEGKDDGRRAVFSGADKFLDYVPDSLPVTVWEKGDFGAAEITREPRKILVGKTDEKLVARMKSNFSYAYPYAADCVLPLKTTVTQVNAESESAADLFKSPLPSVAKTIAADETTDAERGNIAHKIMQHFDFSRADEFDAQIESMTARGAITREELSLVSVERIKKAATSAVFEEIKNCRLYREKSFITQARADFLYGVDSGENVVLQGVIDLLAVGEEITVIDYKYSRLSAAALKKRYATQLNLYAATAEKLLGKKTAKKILVNLFSGDVAEIT